MGRVSLLGQEKGFWVPVLIWKCRSRYPEPCRRLALQAGRGQMFPRCYSLPVWLLRI